MNHIRWNFIESYLVITKNLWKALTSMSKTMLNSEVDFTSFLIGTNKISNYQIQISCVRVTDDNKDKLHPSEALLVDDQLSVLESK